MSRGDVRFVVLMFAIIIGVLLTLWLLGGDLEEQPLPNSTESEMIKT